MLNRIPDKRNANDMSEVFLASNERRDEIEREEKLSSHKTIDLTGRRQSSISSSKSGSSSNVELPTRNSTIYMGKIILVLFYIYKISSIFLYALTFEIYSINI